LQFVSSVWRWSDHLTSSDKTEVTDPDNDQSIVLSLLVSQKQQKSIPLTLYNSEWCLTMFRKRDVSLICRTQWKIEMGASHSHL
jgi:hypothetical protein